MECWGMGELVTAALFPLVQHSITPMLQFPMTPFSSNENGEAIASPRRVILGCLVGRGWGGFGQDVDAVPVLVERDFAGHQGE
jgi:hypothetical protein